MGTFDFHVYNKKTERFHDVSRVYDTDSPEEATALFSQDEFIDRYIVLGVDILVKKELQLIESDF